jgi:hypothetical protein
VSEEDHEVVNEPATEAEETAPENEVAQNGHQALESSDIAENGVLEVEVENTTEVDETAPKNSNVAKNVHHQVLESSEQVVAEDHGVPAEDEVEKNPPAEPNEAATKEGKEGKKGASAEKLPRDEKAQDHPLLYKLHYPRLNFSGTDRSPPKSNLKKKGKEIQKEEKEKRHNDKRKKTRQNAFDKRRMKLFTEQVLERQDEEVNLN